MMVMVEYGTPSEPCGCLVGLVVASLILFIGSVTLVLILIGMLR